MLLLGFVFSYFVVRCSLSHVQNGGKFEFIVESEASLPVEEEFWDFLFSSSKETWNLLVYEQDWLDVAVTRLQALRVSSPPLTHLVFPERLFDYVLPFTHRKF